MNGYVEAGYVVVLGTLGTYGSALISPRASREAPRRPAPFHRPGSQQLARDGRGGTRADRSARPSKRRRPPDA